MSTLSPAPSRRPAASRLTTLLMAAAIVLLWFSSYVYVPILSTYSEAIGADHGLIGLILGSYGFVQMVMRIPIGLASDKWGNRRFFLYAAFAVALVSALGFFLFPHAPLFLLFRSLAGLSVSNWAIYMTAYQVVSPGDDSAKAIGIVSSYQAGGMLLGLFLGGLIAEAGGPDRTFLVSAVTSAAGFLLIFVIVRRHGMLTDRSAGEALSGLSRDVDDSTLSGVSKDVGDPTLSEMSINDEAPTLAGLSKDVDDLTLSGVSRNVDASTLSGLSRNDEAPTSTGLSKDVDDSTLSKDVAHPTPAGSDFVRLLRRRRLIFYSLMTALMHVIYQSTLLGFMPTVLAGVGADDATIGIATTLGSLPSLFGGPLAVGPMKRRFGADGTAMIGFLLMVIGTLPFMATSHLPLLMVLAFVSGMGKGILAPLLMAESVEGVSPKVRATALSIHQAVYSIGMSAGPAITGAISKHFHMAAAYRVLAVIGVVSTGIFLALALHRRRESAA